MDWMQVVADVLHFWRWYKKMRPENRWDRSWDRWKSGSELFRFHGNWPSWSKKIKSWILVLIHNHQKMQITDRWVELRAYRLGTAPAGAVTAFFWFNIIESNVSTRPGSVRLRNGRSAPSSIWGRTSGQVGAAVLMTNWVFYCIFNTRLF